MGLFKYLVIVGAVSLLGLIAFSSNASAQYPVGGSSTGASPSQLEECERLGIDPSSCTENAILAKKRLLQAQGIEATNSQEAITLSKVSDNGRFEAVIIWTSDDIGKANTFRVTLYDPKELGARQPLEDNYDLVIYKEAQNVVPGKVVSFPNGTTEYTVAFPYKGEFTLAVGINDGDEVIEMPIQVTPEFPVAVVPLALIGSIVVAVILGSTRLIQFPWQK